MTYVDATVIAGNVYSYQVKAVNGTASSAYTNIQTVPLTIPATPTSLTVSAPGPCAPTCPATLTWTQADTLNLTSFTIQRATRANFTTGLNVSTVVPNLVNGTQTLVQTVNRNTTYYYRIRANGPSGSSAWRNATQFPIRTPQ